MKLLLKEIRKKKDLTLRQVERMTGVPRSTLFDIEKKGDMPLSTAVQIAKGLHIKITDLFISD